MKYKPDGNDNRCQCVMDHHTFIEGDLEQCSMPRWRDGSNLFCHTCEKTHGTALSKKTKA